MNLWRQDEGSILGQCEMGVPGDFPDVVVGVGEITGAAAPGGIGSRLENLGSGGGGFEEDLVDLILGRDVVGERDAGKARGSRWDVGIFGEFFAREQGQGEAA